MAYGLAAVSAAVYDNPVPVVLYPQHGGNLGYKGGQMGNNLDVVLAYIIQGCDMYLGYQKNMHRGFGVNIMKNQNLVILIDYPGRYLLPSYFAKQAIFHYYTSFINEQLDYIPHQDLPYAFSGSGQASSACFTATNPVQDGQSTSPRKCPLS
jgi:hypothetical protein